MNVAKRVSVLFVCSGNICRSPAAQAVLIHHLAAHPWGAEVRVDSAGTGAWHEGEVAHHNSRAVGARRGYTLDHRARILTADDWACDLIIGMDHGHDRHLRRLAPTRAHRERVRMLRSFDPAAPHRAELEDPYDLAEVIYERMYDQIEACMTGLVNQCYELVIGAVRR